MHPDMVKAFMEDFTCEANRQVAEHDAQRDRIRLDMDKTECDIQRVIEAIKAGVPGAALKDEMTTLESRLIELRNQLESTPAPIPRLHPNLSELYSNKVANLAEALNEENTCVDASQAIQGLIEEVRLLPESGILRIELFGQLAALIGLTNKNPRSNETGMQVTLVAGAGFGQAPTSLELKVAV